MVESAARRRGTAYSQQSSVSSIPNSLLAVACGVRDGTLTLAEVHIELSTQCFTASREYRYEAATRRPVWGSVVPEGASPRTMGV